MFWPSLAALSVLALVVAAIIVLKPLRKLGGEIQIERARELFLLQKERLEAKFLTAASATGKPRGLRWSECIFDGDLQLARDRRTRQLVALAAATIKFEAVEGGDMEGLPAVGNLRNASAVFFFQRGQWLTSGRAVFNLNPGEALEHFHVQFEPVVANGRQSGQ
jgi:hypothetical protein